MWIPPPPEDELTRVTSEMDALLYVIGDLQTLGGGQVVPPPARDALLARYQARYSELYGRWLMLTGQPLPRAAVAASPPLAGPPPARPDLAWAPPGGPAPPPHQWDVRAVLEDNAILVLSCMGGFLLIVAALLFELYGGDHFGDTGRFSAVLVLEAVFGGAAWLAWRRPALRIVAQTYTAVLALLTPITLAAGYLFVLRPAFGPPVEEVVIAGAAACALLYGLLARQLAAEGYAWLSVAAVAVLWNAALSPADAGPWRGAGLAVLCVALAAVSTESPGGWADPFLRPARVALHVAALAAALLSATQGDADPAATPHHLFIPATLAMIAAAYGLAALRQRREGDAAIALTAASLAAVVATQSFRLGGDGEGIALVLTAMAWLAAAAIAGGTSGSALRLGAVAQGLFACLLPLDSGAALAVLLGNVVIALTVAATEGSTLSLVIGSAAIAIHAAVGGALVAMLEPVEPRLIELPLAGAALFAGAVAAGWRQRRAEFAVAAAMIGTGVAVTANHALLGDSRSLSLALLAVGTGAVVAARLLPVARALTDTLAGWAVAVFVTADLLQLSGSTLSPALVLTLTDPGLIAAVAVAVAVLAALVVIERADGRWLYAAAPLGLWAWCAVGAWVAGRPAGIGDAALLLSPAPGLLVLAGEGLRVALPDRRDLHEPLRAIGALTAGAVLIGALADGRLGLAGITLIAAAALLALAGARDGDPRVVPGAAALAAGGAIALLASAAAPAAAYPLVLALLGAAVWLSGMVEERRRTANGGERWSSLLQLTGLTLTAAVAAGSWATPGFLRQGSDGSLTALAAGGVLALQLLAHGVTRGDRRYLGASLVTAAVSLDWVSIHLSATNPQAYALIPGLALIGVGLGFHADETGSVAADTARLMVGSGGLLVLGTTALQALGMEPTTGPYVALVVLEGAIAIAVAVAARNRTLALVGAAGLVGAALRAMYLGAQEIPLYAVFAGAALLMLLVGAALATGRERIGEARRSAGRRWEEWS